MWTESYWFGSNADLLEEVNRSFFLSQEKFKKVQTVAHTSREAEVIFPSPKTEGDQDLESLREREVEVERKEKPRREKIPSGRKNKPLAGEEKGEKERVGRKGRARSEGERIGERENKKERKERRKG